MGDGYVSVSIPEKLMKKVDELLEAGDTIYNSKADFVKDAIRLRLREFGVIT